MNYKMHYDTLIERAGSRTLDMYTEKHHIVPKCLGGTDDICNLAILTAEEHYVAHQLLVKIYPGNVKLLHAAMMMVAGNRIQKRNNKIYGWLKRKYVIECKKRVGKNNPSYGKYRHYNPVTLENGKFAIGYVPTDWLKGRLPKKKCFCQVCDTLLDSHCARFCDEHRPDKTGSKRAGDKRFNERKEDFIKFIKEGYSFDASLKLVGYKNYNMKFGVGKKAQRLLDDLNIQRPANPIRPPRQ